MVGLRLRPYQELALHHVQRRLLAGEHRLYVSQPPATGKTVLLARLAAQRQHLGRVLVLEHRQDLVRQTAQTIQAEGLAVGMLMQRHHRLDMPVVVATVQSLKPEVLHQLLASHEAPVATLLIDEAHHAVPGSAYERIITTIERTAPCPVAIVGFTATPFRSDRRSMLALLPTCAFERTIPDIVQEGYLAPLLWQPVQVTLNLETVELQNREGEQDYADEALARALQQDALNEQIARHVVAVIGQRPTLVFAASVRHAESLTEAFRKQYLRAATVTGRLSQKQRERLYAAWQAGEIQVVCTCALLTEGFDFPAIAALVIARPTRSPGFYLQMLGRGMRMAEGKTNCLVIAVIGNQLDLGQQVALPQVIQLPDAALPRNMKDPRRQRRQAHKPEPVGAGSEESNGLAVLDPTGHSPYRWITYRHGFFALISPEVVVIIERDLNLSGLYRSRLAIMPRGQPHEQSWVEPRYLPLRQQIELIHEATRPYYKESFGSKEAAWLSRPPTEKQWEALARMSSRLAEVARTEGWTSGRVSLLLSRRSLIRVLKNPPDVPSEPASSASAQPQSDIER